jgi:hypothetical protein
MTYDALHFSALGEAQARTFSRSCAPIPGATFVADPDGTRHCIESEMREDLRVELDGETGDLIAAVHSFSDFEPKVVKIEGIYYLRSVTFEGINDVSELHERAKELLRGVNLGLKMQDTAHRDLRIRCISFLEDGERKRLGYLEGASSLRIRSSARFDVVGQKPRPSNAQRFLKLASIRSSAAEVLRYWSIEPRDGAWLYKVYEVIKDDMGGCGDIAAAGLKPLDDIKSFTGSVNRPDVLGDFARHARMPGPPPQHTMDEAEATSFVQTLAINWLLYRYEEALRDGLIRE